MSGHAAVGAKGNDHVRTKLADPLHQIADHLKQIRFGEVRVLVVENLPMLNPEQAARVSQLASAHLGQFSVGLGAAAIAGCGSGRQTDDADLDSALGIQSKRAAEAAGFVVGMSGDAEKSGHSTLLLYQEQPGESPLYRDLPGASGQGTF